MKRYLRKILFVVFCFFALGSYCAYSQTSNIVSTSFSWSMPVSMSVFFREGYIWIVFDHRQMVDLEGLTKSLKRFKPQILQIPHSKATVLRIKLKDGVYPFVRKEGLLWIVDFIEGDREKLALKPIQTMIQYDSLKQAYVFVPTTTFADPISVVDPDLGDTILVGTSTETGLGMPDNYSFIDFDFLNSVQGLALAPKSDDLRFVKGNRGLSIKGYDRALNISDNLETLKRHQLLSQQEDPNKIFVLGLAEGLLKQDFIITEEQLKKDIRLTAPESKNRARFELAKYYIAKGLGFEALGVLEAILKEEDVASSQKEKIFALRGVANFLTRKYKEAIEDFSYGRLKDNDNAIFWRQLAASALSPQKDDNTVLMAFISVIKDYPQELKDRIALIGAQSSINARDDLSAQNFIDILKLSSFYNKRIIPQMHYLIAQNMYLQGYAQNAFREFELAANSDSQKYSSYARFDKALLGLKIKVVSLKSAIAEMERLKFAWGEKSFKIKVLDSLAQLYVMDKDYYNAVLIMIEKMNLVEAKRKKQINDQIVSLFENLYIQNQADEIAPLKALSLYDEYLSFIKQSKRYIEVVIKISDRFMAVDLLDRAEKILDEAFVSPKINAEEKYKVGTRLALINTYDENPSRVLEVLSASEMKNPDVSLEEYRKVLKAMAYKKMGQYDKALEILKEEFFKLALLLKADIYWLNEDWEELFEELKYLIDEPEVNKPLSDEQVKYILDWLMALKKGGKETLITRARAKFEPWFVNTKYYSSFDILTSQLEYNRIDTKDIEERIKNMVSYSDFAKKVAENLDVIGKGKVQK